MNQKLKEKITESLSSVLPVTCIVLILGITITPIPLDPLMLFLAGAAFLIIGMGFFTLGVDMAMMPIGEKGRCAAGQGKKASGHRHCMCHHRRHGHSGRTGPAGPGQTDTGSAGHGAHPGSGCRSRFLPGTCISSLPLRLEPFPHSSGLLHHSLHPGLLYSR